MLEQSYVLAGGPHGSWAGFLIRQEGGGWGRLVLVLQKTALINQSSNPSLGTLMPAAKAARRGKEWS